MPVAANTNRQGKAVVMINGNSFISGLLWQPLRQANLMREARQFGRREGMNMVCVRKSRERSQGGFVSSSAGVNKGMLSLACAVAGQLGDNFLAGFALPDGRYAIVAANSGSIVPAGDKVVDSLDELDSLLREIASLHTYDEKQIYCPGQLRYSNQELDIVDLLKVNRLKDKTYRLRPLEFSLGRDEWVKIGVATALVSVTVVASLAWLYVDRQQEKERLAELARLNSQVPNKQGTIELVRPWVDLVAPNEFLQACNAELYKLPLVLGGWVSDKARCVADNLEITYTRSELATSIGLLNAVKPWFEIEPVLSDDGDSAQLNSFMQMVKVGDTGLLPADQLITALNSHFQALGIKPNINEQPYVAPAKPLPGSAEAELPAPPRPTWRTFTLQIDSHIPPEMLFAGIENQGIRLEEIQVTRSTGQVMKWSIKGMIYAN